MELKKVLFSAFAATTVMTLFSYISSDKGKNFREPELLAVLLKSALPALGKESAVAAGWLTHYTMGLTWAFVLLYPAKPRKMPVIYQTVPLGAFSGTTGVLIWNLAFNIIRPTPMPVERKRFYPHLLLAHVVYTYMLILSRRRLGR